MKRFILLLTFLFLFLPVGAQIITGEVEYNAEYNDIEKYSIDDIRTRLYDSGNSENIGYLLNGVTELKDRKLAKFSDGSYAVQYYDNPLTAWYYSYNGKLIAYTKKDTENYPCKFTKFKPDGTVINSGIRLTEQESYIYSSEGRLLAHWVGDKCFDKNNNLIMTRRVMK